MKKTRFSCISTMTLITILLVHASWAAQVYVTDTREMALHSSPSNQSRLLAKVPVGSPVEVLGARDDWSRVRYFVKEGEAIEGWLQSKLLGTRPPKGKELELENASLKDKLAALQRDKGETDARYKDLAEKYQAASEKLDKIEKDYEELKSGSVNYLKVKAEYDAAKTALAAAQENTQTLIQENLDLRLSQRIKWFVTGALVLLGGWLTGLIMGRSQRKRRATYRM